MKVNEYMKKFEDLFNLLDAEHGHLDNIEIRSTLMMDENGKYTIKKPRVFIHFVEQ